MDVQTELPFQTDDIDPIGGSIKASEADFLVEEIPLYEPEDDGQHVYVRLTREGMTTREVVDELAGVFGVPKSSIGYAGMKDKEARTTQTFSLDTAQFERPKPSDKEVAEQVADKLGVEVEFARRHRNKLRRGHLIGNRFRIVVTDVGEGASEQAGEIAEALVERGVPNFYGAQRFGQDNQNAERGREIIETGKFDGPHWKRNLLCNAYQSELFNRWLTRRIEEGLFGELMLGDIAKKTDTGGLFEVKHLSDEQPRFERREITFTGPIYGDDLWWAEADAGELERDVLSEAAFEIEDFGNERLSGSRRRGRIHIDEIAVKQRDRGVELAFELPKGAYATVVLREFVR